MNREMIEFRITSNPDDLRKQAITTNYPEVKEWVTYIAEQYATVVVTEDNVPAAKQDRADLRKLQAGIDQVRKEGKAAALSACAELEANCKELNGILETAVANLDSQAKAFDQRRKDEKEAKLRAHFDKQNEFRNTNHILTWERIFDPKWLNTTVSEETAIASIEKHIDDAVNAIAAIQTLHSEFETTLIDLYRQTLDMTAVLQKNNQLVMLKQQEQERQRALQEQMERKPVAEQKPEPVAEVTEVEETEEAEEENTFAEEQIEQELTTLVFRVTGTREQLMELAKYMKNSGLVYGRAN